MIQYMYTVLLLTNWYWYLWVLSVKNIYLTVPL